MQAAVAAIIVDVVINMASKVIKNKHVLPIAVMVLAFIAAALLNVNIVIILLVCGVIGAYTTYSSSRAAGEKEERK